MAKKKHSASNPEPTVGAGAGQQEDTAELDTNPSAPTEDTGPGCTIKGEKVLHCRYIGSIASANWSRKPTDEEDLPESVALSFAEAGTVVIIQGKPETATGGPTETR